MNISVIIPVYNAERFLEKAVASALQFPQVKEVLLVEDGSPDASLEVCKKLLQKDARIKLFQHPDRQNHGAGATRNLGLEKASEEFIAFLDADDYYLPNRFDAEREIFKNENIDGVFGAIGTEFLTEKGREEFSEKFKHNKLTTVKYAAEGKDILFGITGVKEGFGSFFHLDTLTIRSEKLRQCGLKFNDSLKLHQDRDFIVKLSHNLILKTGIIDEAVAIRGVHDDNRITKIRQYSTAFYQNILKLYQSLYSWTLSEKDLPEEVKNHIKLRYLTFTAANKKGLSKVLYFAYQSILHPQLLRTRYRFHALKKHL